MVVSASTTPPPLFHSHPILTEKGKFGKLKLIASFQDLFFQRGRGGLQVKGSQFAGEGGGASQISCPEMVRAVSTGGNLILFVSTV